MLERIKKTNDIHKLNLVEKNILAKEIREYIIDVVSKNGGHLASNLGVVELTIALHSCFDLNKDKLIFDVGHQCYTHKILTGRKEELKTLRKLNGISGFPKESESKTDAFNTGHSSTSISAALGYAAARDIEKKDFNVVAVIGDGALTGGMAMEALNHAGSMHKKMIIILNDNEMSISKNVGGINDLLTRLRSKKNFRKSNERGKKFVINIPLIGKPIYKLVKRLKKALKGLIIPGMYFEEIGIRYLGPVDGHNIEDLEHLLNKAKELDGPTLIHVLTKKGYGYKPAEDTPSAFHGVSSFDIETGLPLKIKSKDYSKTFGDKLVKMAKKNKKIVAITAAMADGTGLSEFAKVYPDRFFDVGIAEQHAVTFAAGLAKEGLVPFVSIYSSFYQRCYDQVIHDVACQNLPVIMCVDRAGLVGADGETHQGVFDMSFFNLVPNLVILNPSNFKELEDMMDYAVTLKKPVIIRYPRGGESKLDRNIKPIKNNKVVVEKEGNDLTIIATGRKVNDALLIANEINKNIEVLNVRCIKPIDEKSIIKSINKTKNVIVMEDNTCIGGLTSIVESIITDKKLDVNIFKSFALPNEFINHGSVDELEKKYKVDKDSIKKFIVNKM